MPRLHRKALILVAAAASLLIALTTSRLIAQSPMSSNTRSGETTTVDANGMLGTLDPAVRGALAATLSGWIAGARNEAVASGVETIPREIRLVLTEYLPAAVLDRARWRVDDSVVSVQRALFQMGYTPAVTLDDVIVFATSADAADPKLWAHELYHVRQYLDWGVDGFADRYLADHAAVEHDAVEFRWAWMKATGRVPAPARSPP